MNNFLTRLQKSKIIIGDGAMGTQLQNSGLKSGEASEKWNLKEQEKISKIHKEYIKAGAELIETNTFGGNYIRLKEYGLADKMEEINKKAVEIARKAASAVGKDIYIAGSVGPSGKLMQPYGTLSSSEVYNSYKKQISILVENKVDVILIETLTDLSEMEEAVKAVNEFSIPVMAQMNFTESGKTVMGNTIQETVALLEDYDVDVIGTNCTPGVEKTIPIIKEYDRETSKPLSVFPNAGKPQMEDGEVHYPETPSDFIDSLDDLLENNVKIFGGCCGTTPEFIAAIKNKLQ